MQRTTGLISVSDVMKKRCGLMMMRKKYKHTDTHVSKQQQQKQKHSKNTGVMRPVRQCKIRPEIFFQPDI